MRPWVLKKGFLPREFHSDLIFSHRIEVVSAQEKVSELIITHGDGLGIHAFNDRTFHDQTMAAAISFLKIFTLILKLLTVLLGSGLGIICFLVIINPF